MNEPEISAYTQFLEEDLWPDDIMDSKGLLKTNEIFRKKAANKITKSYRALGTVIDLTIYGCQDEGILDQSYQLIKYYEDIFTVNRENLN